MRAYKNRALLCLVVMASIAALACGSNGGPRGAYEGFAVESIDGSAKESNAFNPSVQFTDHGPPKFSARRDCSLEYKAAEIVPGQNCNISIGERSYRIQLQDGAFEQSKSADGKHDLITIRLSGTTLDGASYKYVFRGQKRLS